MSVDRVHDDLLATAGREYDEYDESEAEHMAYVHDMDELLGGGWPPPAFTVYQEQTITERTAAAMRLFEAEREIARLEQALQLAHKVLDGADVPKDDHLARRVAAVIGERDAYRQQCDRAWQVLDGHFDALMARWVQVKEEALGLSRQ